MLHKYERGNKIAPLQHKYNFIAPLVLVQQFLIALFSIFRALWHFRLKIKVIRGYFMTLLTV